MDNPGGTGTTDPASGAAPARRKVSKARSIISALVLVAALTALAAVGFLTYTAPGQECISIFTAGKKGPGTDRLSRSQIETVARLTLPAAAENIKSHVEQSEGKRTLWLRFELPVVAAAQFTSTRIIKSFDPSAAPGARERVTMRTGSDDETRLTGRLLHLDREWWKEAQAKSPLTATDHDQGATQFVVIDRGDPQRHVVYILTIED